MSNYKVWATSEHGKIQYVSLTKEHLEEAIHVLNKAFFPYENLCKALGLSDRPEAFVDFYEMMKMIAMDGVSVIAIETDTSKVVGTLLNKIQADTSGSKPFYDEYIRKAKYEESKTVYKVLMEMEEKVGPFKDYNVNCVFELVLLGVLPENSKQGIGQKLCEVSIELASQLYKGRNVKVSVDDTELSLEPTPQLVIASFTNFKTQNIGRKLKFDLLLSINYDDLYHNGKSYSSIIGNDSKGLMIECKKLQ